MLSCRITQLRRISGLNQLQLAQELHISPSTIGMYEQGRRTPNVEMLVQMSKFFNVSLDYLILGAEFVPDPQKGEGSAMVLSCPWEMCRNCRIHERHCQLAGEKKQQGD